MFPSFKDFNSVYTQKKTQVLSLNMTADLETPITAYIKLSQGHDTYTAFFESVEGGEVWGRYSAIVLDPDLIWKAQGQNAWVNTTPQENADSFEPCALPALESLAQLHQDSLFDVPESLPPMVGGLFGYSTYETAAQIEVLPPPHENGPDIPEQVYFRPSLLAIFDRLKGDIRLVALIPYKESVPAQKAYDKACTQLKNAQNSLRAPLPDSFHAPLTQDLQSPSHTEDTLGGFKSNMPEEVFIERVKKAKDYITEGDIFQVVLSQRYALPFASSPLAFYRALRSINPSPYMYLLKMEGFSIIGSSPETLVRVRESKVTVRPIAGTRKRGKTPQKDLQLEQDLLNDPKERAEHLMLLDLGRNDVGRVSEIGTVKVEEDTCVERYSHVMHLVSKVTGTLHKDLSAIDALKAGFPAGTVSGAPKIRAMEIISELETERRGLYAGSVGYLGADGSIDTCIALRTALLKDQTLFVQAGAGIVADSNPELENQECQNKARALFIAAKAALAYETQSPLSHKNSEEE